MRKKISTILALGIFFTLISCTDAAKVEPQASTKNLSVMKLPSKVNGSGSPIVLVPGGLTGWVSWDPHIKILSGYRKVISVQLLSIQLGLENRDLPDNYSVKTESDALAATIDSLSLDTPVDLVAWSYGALTSLQFALDHPERIRTLTLIEPPALWVLREAGLFNESHQKLDDFFMTFKGDISEDMLESFLQTAGFTKPGQSPRELPQWNNWIGFRLSLRNNPAVAKHNDDINRLHSFKKPTLLVKGTGSTPFFHQIIEVLDKQIPDSRVVEFPQGHAPHIVSMNDFLMELKKFHDNAGTAD